MTNTTIDLKGRQEEERKAEREAMQQMKRGRIESYEIYISL